MSSGKLEHICLCFNVEKWTSLYFIILKGDFSHLSLQSGSIYMDSPYIKIIE